MKKNGKPQEANLLWKPGYELPVIAVTGDVGSGKTTFGFLISHPGGPGVRVWDFELGSHQLSRKFGEHYPVDHIEMIQTKAASQELYISFVKSIDDLDWDPYGVAIVDTGIRLQESAYAYATSNPNLFGVSAAQMKNQIGVDWSKTKLALEQLFAKITEKVQTLVIVMHLRSMYSGGKPVPGKFESQGVKTIDMLSSLSLRMHRSAIETKKVNGKDIKLAPHFPTPGAEVIKSRLDHLTVIDDKFVTTPVLPKFLPDATPGAIRHYVDNRVSYEDYSDEERDGDYVPGRDEDPDARADREAERTRTRLESETNEAKHKLVADMTSKYPDTYHNGEDIGAVLNLLGITYSRLRDAEIRSQLSDYVTNT